MTVPRLAFDGVTGGYGSTVIVRGVSGAVAPSEVLCVLGRNGVGKSTLLKLLFGFLPCLGGSIRLDDRPLGALEPEMRRRMGITYCPQERSVFDDLTVHDNLTLTRRDRGLEPFEPYFARFPILERRLGQHAGTLSGGEKKILSFVRGVAEDQPLVLLDEPSEGVQWENILEMEGVIKNKTERGVAFIIVEQNLAFGERVADGYLVMDQGRVVLTGDSATMNRENLVAHLHV
jgi:branched-chain amino acid transport system ATP-binding protein